MQVRNVQMGGIGAVLALATGTHFTGFTLYQ